jgi:magnesium-transporting ATPase (P-type)
MNNLIFCGFLTLKNKLKKEVINSIKDLRQFNCNLIISTGDNVFNCLPIAFDSTIIENKNIFAFDKEDKRIVISKIYGLKNENETEDEQDERNATLSLEKTSKQTVTNRITSSTQISKLKSLSSRLKKETLRNKEDTSLNQGNEISEKKMENLIISNSNKSFNDSLKRLKNSTKISEKDKNISENEKSNSKFSSNLIIPAKRNTGKEKDAKINLKLHKIAPLDLPEKIKTKKSQSKQLEYEQELSTSRRFINKTETISKLEKFYFYPEIFEENEDLTDNCIYSISGRAFNFLYQNKDKKAYKKLLLKIHKYCKIFYNMSSIDKSLAIDFFREFPKACVCTIGKYPNDFDAMMSSNVGINLNPPTNENTILCHFYSADSNILSIKKIIREERAISENIIL